MNRSQPDAWRHDTADLPLIGADIGSRLVGDMRAATFMLVAVLVIGTGPAFAADTVVGSITALHGSVEIDTLGKGTFLAAVRGDRVYSATVLRTGPGAGAVIDLQGSPAHVPPSTTFRIADALEGARRTKRFAWLPSVIGVLKDAVASFGSSGSTVVLGSKAAEVSGSDDEWVVEVDDPAVLLLDARGEVRRGDYLDALADLDAIDGIGGDELPRGEVAFLRGSAYFGLSDFATARAHLEKAEPPIRGRDDPEAKNMLPVLLFQLGASRFFLGQDELAVSTLCAYIALDAKTDWDPFAYQLLLQALVNRGERTKAQEVLARATVRFAGTRYESDFKALPAGP